MTAESSKARTRGLLIAVVVACVALAALTAPGAVAAQEDGPYDLPAAYYGDLEINGDPVDPDDGVVVEAEIDEEVRGSVDVDEEGVYGSDDALDERLVVNGYADEDAGQEVTFYVDGDDFDRTEVTNTSPESVTWESESIERVDLSVDVEIDPRGGGGGGGGGGGAPPVDPADPDDPDDPEPTADISIDPDPATVGDEVTFDAGGSSVDEGDLTEFEWTIDGETDTGETVTETFDDPGTVDVELTVTTDAGETDTATDSLTVEADESEEVDAQDDDDEDDGSLPVPGFGVAAALVALLTVALLATRRRA